MKIEIHLKDLIQQAFRECYGEQIDAPKLDKTRPEFEGDYTLVVFPYLRQSKKGPEQTAEDLGAWLKTNSAWVSDFNVIKGFLNLVISDDYWTEFANEFLTEAEKICRVEDGKGQKVMVEYSSPNTNKPLHLGHIRNNLL
ncbi:MAG: arginine--tRNA ligase, partial [Bacteroidota bacterium]|nr:arginine--tRNA ligase [Bacteroidota bacterium]MDX5431618.1 arginine--tRNA ligase [Bacteroidota bacterium]MDX5470337.1 arginine--tRNA ligase [Bacteroidota bacterium]